jgi:hypothetical protein
MKDVIYLEPDIEITSVIDKIRKTELKAIILVVPRGSSLTQSIVNLKLLKRRAEDEHKVIALVSGDKVTHNLAEQLKIHCFEKVTEAERADFAPDFEAIEQYDKNTGLKVHTYQKYRQDEEAEKPTEESKEADIGEVSENEDDGPLDSARGRDAEPNMPEGFETKKIPEIEYTKDEIKSFEKEEFNDNKVEEIEREINQKERAKVRHIRPQGSRKVFLVFGIIALVLILAGAYLYLPTAKASVVLKSNDITENLNITIDKNAKNDDLKNSILAGKLVDLEKDITKQFDATGTKDLGEKAIGKITVTNSSNLNSNALPKGTKFTANGRTFVSTEAVTAKGATVNSWKADSSGNPVPVFTPESVEVSVEAESTGEAYNIAPSTFVISSLPAAKQTYLVGKSSVAFAGGTTKQVKVVTEDDLKNAEAAIKKEALALSSNELGDKASKNGLKIFDNTIDSEVIAIAPDKKADDQAEIFNVVAKIKMFALGFSESGLKNLVRAGVESKIKSNEMLINPDAVDTTYEVAESNLDDGIIKVKTVYKGKYGAKIAESSIKANIKGKSLSEAANYLKGLDGVDSASIGSTPSFIKTVPYFSNKITVKFDYSK